MCKHQICHKVHTIRKNNNRIGYGGAACIVLNNYFEQRWVALLGHERGGDYKGTYNLCAGKVDIQDNGCYVATVIRELEEEFKIKIQESDLCDKNGNLRVFYKGSPIFILIVKGLKRNDVNQLIGNDCKNKYLPSCMREMDKVNYFDLQSQRQIENKNDTVSTFASAVMKLIDVTKLS